jgi:hypothetical protein
MRLITSLVMIHLQEDMGVITNPVMIRLREDMGVTRTILTGMSKRGVMHQ